MTNQYLSGISNNENIFWIRFKPDLKVVIKIDKIVKKVDTEFKEGILFLDEKIKDYSKFYPKRYSHEHGDKIYAISIFHKDLIDFIILKDHPIYEKVFELYKKEFK